MLSEQQIRDEIARRDRITLPFIIVSFLLMIPAVVFMFWFDKANSANSFRFSLFLGSVLASAFISLAVGHLRADRIKLRCPLCQASLSFWLRHVLRTHHCESCHELIVGEIPPDDAVPVEARLTARKIRAIRQRRHQAAGENPLLLLGLLIVFVVGLAGSDEFEFPWKWISLTVSLSSVVTFCYHVIQGQRRASTVRTVCPNCHICLNDRESTVFKTSRCPACNCVIFQKDPREEELLKRYRRYLRPLARHKLKNSMHRVLWALVACQGVFSYTSFTFHNNGLVPLPSFHLAVSLTGLGMIVITCYVWIRSRNQRCFYPLVVLCVLVAYTLSLAWLEFSAPLSHDWLKAFFS